MVTLNLIKDVSRTNLMGLNAESVELLQVLRP